MVVPSLVQFDGSGIVDGNCRVKIYIHLVDLTHPRPQAQARAVTSARAWAWGRGWTSELHVFYLE